MANNTRDREGGKVIAFPVHRINDGPRQRPVAVEPSEVRFLPSVQSHFDPSQLPRLVQQGHDKNRKDDETPQYRMSLSQPCVRFIEAVYLLLFPDLQEDELIHIERIRGIKMSGDYPFPLLMPGFFTEEYGFRYRFLDDTGLRMKLEIASPSHDLEAFLRREGGLPQSVDAVMITSAAPQNYNGRQGKKVFYLPSISKIESVHPSSASMVTRVEIGYGRGTGIHGGIERVFCYNGEINSL